MSQNPDKPAKQSERKPTEEPRWMRKWHKDTIEVLPNHIKPVTEMKRKRAAEPAGKSKKRRQPDTEPESETESDTGPESETESDTEPKPDPLLELDSRQFKRLRCHLEAVPQAERRTKEFRERLDQLTSLFVVLTEDHVLAALYIVRKVFSNKKLAICVDGIPCVMHHIAYDKDALFVQETCKWVALLWKDWGVLTKEVARCCPLILKVYARCDFTSPDVQRIADAMPGMQHPPDWVEAPEFTDSPEVQAHMTGLRETVASLENTIRHVSYGEDKDSLERLLKQARDELEKLESGAANRSADEDKDKKIWLNALWKKYGERANAFFKHLPPGTHWAQALQMV